MSIARHHACARVTKLLAAVSVVAAFVSSCSGDRVVQPYLDGEVALPLGNPSSALGVPTPIEFATYDNSNQVVHPSAVSFSSAWHGQRYWLALTPYPNSDSRVENPSLFASATGDDWSTPPGVTNPLEETKRGYLSDPDLVFDPSADELRLYYREVVESRHRHGRRRHEADILYLTRSGDGVHWSTPSPLVTTGGRFIVSPAVTRRADSDWKMWSVDAGRAGCGARETSILMRESIDGIAWSAATRVAFTQPGYSPWHLDVQWVPQLGAYWALVAAYPRGHSCTESSLFLATSTDGTTWTTFPSPVLARGVLPQFSTNVYRSTFAFEPDGDHLTIWLTGATTVKHTGRRQPMLRWSAAVWHTQKRALLDHVRLTPVTLMPVESDPGFLRHIATENALP